MVHSEGLAVQFNSQIIKCINRQQGLFPQEQKPDSQHAITDSTPLIVKGEKRKHQRSASYLLDKSLCIVCPKQQQACGCVVTRVYGFPIYNPLPRHSFSHSF
ncbi:hypothetical protein BGZ63DRAFT_115030 [Mariannaea sp. PMI_226]|nr:hypothetical protein BGZ63DRAFT_115030 [Mariannaea sp. PMI_226]